VSINSIIIINWVEHTLSDTAYREIYTCLDFIIKTSELQTSITLTEEGQVFSVEIAAGREE
jgi:hypothetical protein